MPIHSTLETPLGRLWLQAEHKQLTGIYFDDQKHFPASDKMGEEREAAGVLHEAETQLREYFVGTRQAFDLPLKPEGTIFQARVWRAIAEIPYGETVTYGEIARRCGCPKAVRAVGLATGRNPLCVVVPCHRVVGAKGALTGYAGGLTRKAWLLNREADRKFGVGVETFAQAA